MCQLRYQLGHFCANLRKTGANFVARFKPTCPSLFLTCKLGQLSQFYVSTLSLFSTPLLHHAPRHQHQRYWTTCIRMTEPYVCKLSSIQGFSTTIWRIHSLKMGRFQCAFLLYALASASFADAGGPGRRGTRNGEVAGTLCLRWIHDIWLMLQSPVCTCNNSCVQVKSLVCWIRCQLP